MCGNELEYSEFSELHMELLFYLEDKILYNIATEDEIVIYEDYKLFNEFNIDSQACKKLLREMQNIYESGYK